MQARGQAGWPGGAARGGAVSWLFMDDGASYVIWLKDEQETMIRRVFRDARPAPNSVCLQPLDHTLRPHYTYPSNIVIQGRLLSVIRDYENGRYLRVAGATCGG